MVTVARTKIPKSFAAAGIFMIEALNIYAPILFAILVI